MNGGLNGSDDLLRLVAVDGDDVMMMFLLEMMNEDRRWGWCSFILLKIHTT
jgi:hypothetical protein